MKLEKVIARKVVFPAMMALQADKVIRMTSDHAILHIMYHGVSTIDGTYFSPRHITKDQFEEHLKYYKKNFNIVTVPEAFYLAQNKIKPKQKTIAITFDDGYKNNLQIALPLLEKYKIKASFYISSVCVGDMPVRTLWSDMIAALQYFNKDKIVDIGEYKFKNLVELNSGLNLYDYLKKCPYPERERILEKLISEFDLDDRLKSIPEELWKQMTKEEIIQMAGSAYVDIGSHGHLHYNLGNTNLDFAVQELKQSKALLEGAIQKEVNMIAYPDGSYTESVKDEAEKAGYKYQLAVNYRCPEDGSDHRIMSRYGISSTTTFGSNMINLSRAFNTRGI